MSIPVFVYNCYYIIILLAAIICIRLFKMLEPGLKVFSLYIFLTVITEYIAYYSAVVYHTNTVIYAIYSMLQFFTICLYFNYTITIFRKRNTGLWIGVGGLIVGLLNSLFLQPFDKGNNYFLFFAGIVTIGMVLFSYARIMIEGTEQSILRNPHFWIGAVLIFNWSLSFCNWTLYNYPYLTKHHLNWIISWSILLVNVITYSGIAIIFLNYPKWKYRNG